MPTSAPHSRRRVGDVFRIHDDASGSSSSIGGNNHQPAQHVAPGASNNANSTPQNPEHPLTGRDLSSADLSLTQRLNPDSINPRTGEPWLYPKRTGRSNLDDFREEIEERTRNGQGCKAIAQILIEKGVETTDKAVATRRIKWGVRQRVRLW